MHTYQPVRTSREWDDKNVDGSHLDEEEFREMERGRPQRARRWRSRLAVGTHVLVAAAALVAIGVEGRRAGLFKERSIVPDFGTEIRYLTPLPSYEQPSNWESDELWSAAIPGNKGFVTVDNPTAYGLPLGLPNFDNQTTKYGVSWTHEYHCLDMTRKEFWKAIAGSSTLYGGDQEENDLSEASRTQLHHIGHCFDYIRQLIMCRGDMTIEWGAESSDGPPDRIDGYGIPHKCVKFEELYNWMDAHPAMEEPGPSH